MLTAKAENVELILKRLKGDEAMPFSIASALRTICRRAVGHQAGHAITCDSGDGYLGLLSGWACRERLWPDGRRQIFSFHLPGDIIMPVASHSWTRATTIVALTKVQTTSFKDFHAKAGEQAADRISALLSHAVGHEIGRLIDHISRLGYQSASQRVMHLFREFDRRLAEVGLSERHDFVLPIQQSTLADALGLSTVHINRTLQQMRRDGLIENLGRRVRLLAYDSANEAHLA